MTWLSLLVLAVSSSYPRSDDATLWSVNDVAAWAGEAEGIKDVESFQGAVKKYSINGKILMVMDASDLEVEFGIESPEERKFLMKEIGRLKDSPVEKGVRLTFWEMRSLNKQLTDYVAPLLTLAPRLSITVFDDFPVSCLT